MSLAGVDQRTFPSLQPAHYFQGEGRGRGPALNTPWHWRPITAKRDDGSGSIDGGAGKRISAAAPRANVLLGIREATRRGQIRARRAGKTMLTSSSSSSPWAGAGRPPTHRRTPPGAPFSTKTSGGSSPTTASSIANRRAAALFLPPQQAYHSSSRGVPACHLTRAVAALSHLHRAPTPSLVEPSRLRSALRLPGVLGVVVFWGGVAGFIRSEIAHKRRLRERHQIYYDAYHAN